MYGIGRVFRGPQSPGMRLRALRYLLRIQWPVLVLEVALARHLAPRIGLAAAVPLALLAGYLPSRWHLDNWWEVVPDREEPFLTILPSVFRSLLTGEHDHDRRSRLGSLATALFIPAVLCWFGWVVAEVIGEARHVSTFAGALLGLQVLLVVASALTLLKDGWDRLRAARAGHLLRHLPRVLWLGGLVVAVHPAATAVLDRLRPRGGHEWEAWAVALAAVAGGAVLRARPWRGRTPQVPWHVRRAVARVNARSVRGVAAMGEINRRAFAAAEAVRDIRVEAIRRLGSLSRDEWELVVRLEQGALEEINRRAAEARRRA